MVQDLIKKGRIKIVKVSTEKNVSDMGTKKLAARRMK